MVENTLLLPLLSGLLLLAIAVGVLRLRNWRHAAAASAGPRSAEVAFSRAIRSPTTWTVGFLVLVLLALAGTLAMVGAIPLPESARPTVTTALLAASGVVLGGFVFLGVYAAVRERGYGSAPAVGLAALVVGLVVLLVVIARLFLG